MMNIGNKEDIGGKNPQTLALFPVQIYNFGPKILIFQSNILLLSHYHANAFWRMAGKWAKPE